MCGIAGIINGGSPEQLKAMAMVQAYRGPDDWGMEWFAESSSGLAHRRLSIIDLSPLGHQPMKNKSGNRFITFNGEVYNYLEIRQTLINKGHQFNSNSDTEVILKAFDEWGYECVKKINGMFAFGIYDTITQELFIARDQLGIKPLYYQHCGDMFAFASEAKALFELDKIKKEINFNAVVSSLLFLWVPEPETGFKNILKLEAGHYAVFKNNKLTVTQYWDVPINDAGGLKKNISKQVENNLIDELDEILNRVIRRQMIADVPVGAFLSGGLDSSLITALMRKINNGVINTYTIAFSPEDKRLEAMSDDAKYAKIVADYLHTNHREIEVGTDINKLMPKMLWHLDEPIADGAAINTFLISQGAKQDGTTVLLSGMGGDEVFGGYRKQLATLLIEKYHKLPKPLRKAVLEPVVNALPVNIFNKGIKFSRWGKKFLRSAQHDPMSAFIYGFAYLDYNELQKTLAPKWHKTSLEEYYPIQKYREFQQKCKGIDIISAMTYLDTKLFLTGINLAYSDKASMAASIESRPPLIDIELVEFAAKLPPTMKIQNKTQKYLLKKVAERYLPKEIIYRPKAAFGTPIRAWMKRGLDNEVREMFQNPSTKILEYLNPNLPLEFLKEHIAGKEDNAHRLWGLYSMGLWLELNQ